MLVLLHQHGWVPFTDVGSVVIDLQFGTYNLVLTNATAFRVTGQAQPHILKYDAV
jgi:hypothetical protein